MQNIRKNAQPVLEVLEARLNPANIALLDQVSLMYRVGLDRDPDPQGLTYYSAQLENGVPPVDVARQILFSPEHNEKVIRGYYSEILGREPDAAGLASHQNSLNGIYVNFDGILGQVTQHDHKKWIDILSISWGSERNSSRASEESLAASFLASPEKSGTLNNAAYVDMVYRTVLGRSPDTQGLKNWLNKLSSGTSRQAVAQAILESREASTYAVDGMYVSILGRQPSTAEKQGWIQALQDPFVTYADVAAAFLGSAEARTRLAGNDNPLMTVVEPSTTFWQKNISFATQGNHGVTATAPLKLNPVVQLSHFGQDIAFTEDSFGIASIPITSGGSGYTSPPDVTIAAPVAGGVGAKTATATATIQNGVITGWTIGNNSIVPGQKGPYYDTTSGKVVNPVITIEDPSNHNNTTASFTADLDADGNFIGLKNVKGGQGYDPDNLPTVTVTGAVDQSKNATITIQKTGNPTGLNGNGNFNGISNGVVTAITVTSPGQGYAPNETVAVTIGQAPVAADSAILGTVTAGMVEVPSRSKFQAWANDYITYVANTGVSTCFINIGDYLADTKGLYNYLKPDPTNNGIPWIVTDFLNKLASLQNPDGTPADVEVGAIAYLKDAWHLYDEKDNPNYDGNLLISDGRPVRTEGLNKAYSPPKNNMYQALQLVNEINSYATTKFITHFEFDGEGGGAFVQDDPAKGTPSYYGFNTSTDQVVQPPGGDWSYQPAPPSEGVPQPGTNQGWPTTGPGYTKWLWNHLMPGVAESDLAPGGKMPGSQSGGTGQTFPDVVFTDTEAVDPATWSENGGKPYQFGSISYSQPAWFPSSPGPVQSYSENYWWGENNYMPGDSSSLWSNPNGQTTFQSTDTGTYQTPPLVTFNTPTGGTPAAGYAVLATGSADLGSAYEDSTKTTTIGYTPLDPSGLITNPSNIGGGYSTGIWISAFPNQPNGYRKGDTITFANPAPGGRGATGTLDVDNNGKLLGVSINDPGVNWATEPDTYLINGKEDAATGQQKATFRALLTESNGYPTLTFAPPANGGRAASGFAVVTSQDNKPGTINQIVITDPGEGYEKSLNTTLDGKSTAQLVPNLDSEGRVVSITVVNPGAGYTEPPTITFVPGYHDYPTSQASATAVLDDKGGVASVTVNDGGLGYISALTVLVSPPQGGTISGVKVVISQTPAPQDILSQYTGTGNTPQAAGVPLQGGGNGYYLIVSKAANSIDHIVVTRSGSGYKLSGVDSATYTLNNSANSIPVPPLQPGATTPIDTSTYNKAYAPIFDLSGGYILNGNGQSLVGILDGGSGYSAGVVVNNPGNYGLAPTVNFSPAPSGGTTATGNVVWDSSTGEVTGVQVTNPGSGYTAEPTITFTKDPGDSSQVTAASATAYVLNYPVVTIGQGRQGSSQAAAYALVGPGGNKDPDPNAGYVVKGIAFTNYGSGYVPQGATAGQAPTLTAELIAALPTMTVSAPSDGRAALVDGQFAIVNKWNAFWVDGTGSITSQVGPASSATLESVGSVTVNSAGSGYGWDAQVTFAAPPAGGETAVGHVVLNSDGSVNRIAITNPGSGYASPPTATVTSPSNTGTGALLTINPLVPKIRGGGNVYNYEIWDGTPGNSVTAINIVSTDSSHVGGGTPQNGTGYSPGDMLVFSGGTPLPGKTITPPVATVKSVNSAGGVTAFDITSGGSGFATPPSVTITRSKPGQETIDAQLQASLVNSVLSANSIDAVYAHYAGFPEALAQMFNDPKYTAESSLKKLSDRSYQKLNLNQDFKQITPNLPGNGISQGAIATFSLESVLLSNTGTTAVQLGAGGGATATATSNNAGSITSIAVTNKGSNYQVPPLVQIVDPNGKGTGATATATLTNGSVSGITVTAGGTNYSSNTVVNLVSQGLCLDAKYHDPSELLGVNALGGTFGGLSMLSYNDFITFLNTAADIVVGSQEASGINLQSGDYTVSGSTLTSAVADFQNIRKGMTVEGVGVPAGTVVTANPVSAGNSFSVTLSNPVTGTPALTFYNPISASDVTFSIYDSAFLPLSWLDGQVTNGWKEPNTAPKFSGLLTAGTVAPTALAGTVIYTALATDNDLLAANKRITYDLKRGLGDDATLLRINPSTGQVMLRYAASQFPRQSYTFTVVATDGGGLSVEKTVTVPVVYT
jgi:hypothetical protein